ncbi:serotriflin-like [Rhineura floridana]|uniref:serotriflin-like n=1 Tax=Rhineura floridana TaxID=261503 RepID=UPI002AC817A2|nr:serotriflin-like [Rhineura floridana]
MLLPIVLLSLAALLQQSLGQGKSPIVNDVPLEKQKEILHTMNNIRKQVDPTATNMLKMKWNKKAAANAKKYAAKCQFRSSPIEERKVDGIACGETLSQSVTANGWPVVIASWASTKSSFMYGVGPTDPKKSIYSYTQLIWYKSHEVGCALAYCPENTFSFFYLCHYCPGGNIQDTIATPYKKGSTCGDCPANCEDKLCTNPCKYADLYSECDNMKQSFTCNLKIMHEYCKASCKCSTEII